MAAAVLGQTAPKVKNRGATSKGQEQLFPSQKGGDGSLLKPTYNSTTTPAEAAEEEEEEELSQKTPPAPVTTVTPLPVHPGPIAQRN